MNQKIRKLAKLADVASECSSRTYLVRANGEEEIEVEVWGLTPNQQYCLLDTKNFPSREEVKDFFLTKLISSYKKIEKMLKKEYSAEDLKILLDYWK